MVSVPFNVASFGATLIQEARRVMDVMLHLGAHRTGTTTFQSYLERNRTRLSQAGIAVWTPERTRGGLLAGLIHRPADINAEVARRAQRSTGLVQVERQVLERAGHHSLLVSEENMIGAARNNLREERLYPDLLERLMRFRAAMEGAVTRIGLCLRSYDGFWSSSLAFAVAQGHAVPSQSDLDRLTTQPRRWRDVVRDVASVFPAAELVVWPFERFVDTPRQQLDLMVPQAAALDLSATDDWRNPAPRLERLRELVAERGDLSGLSRLPAGQGRWMPFDDAQRTMMRDIYAEDLEWLRSGADGFARFAETSRMQLPETAVTLTHKEFMGDSAGRWSPQTGGRYDGKQRYLV